MVLLLNGGLGEENELSYHAFKYFTDDLVQQKI